MSNFKTELIFDVMHYVVANFYSNFVLSDIRDAVKYKEVMKQYGLGPNGGIVTSLNLFATKFQQVVSLLDQRSSQYELAIIDTPG